MTGYLWTVSAGGTLNTGAGTNSISVTWNTSGPQTVSVNYTNGTCTAASATVYNVNVNSSITSQCKYLGIAIRSHLFRYISDLYSSASEWWSANISVDEGRR